MNSGLAFQESTGAVNSDLVRMLTQEADMANYAAKKPLTKQPGKKWVFIRNHQHPQSDPETCHQQRSALLELSLTGVVHPPRMNTAVLESDASGTLVGSSLVWASGRDWARFGQLYLDQGRWNGQQLPPNWVKQARTASRGSGGYGRTGGSANENLGGPTERQLFCGGLPGTIPPGCPFAACGDRAPGTDTEKPGFDANGFGADVLSALR